MEYGLANPLIVSPSTADILNNFAIPQAPEPQPTLGTNVPDIHNIVATISEQLALLATVISQGVGTGNSHAEDQSLQACVDLTLQQAEWFKEMVEQAVDKRDFDELVSEATHDRVCSEVEEYFNYRFSPEDHFDFGDAVENAVDDRLEDVVRDRLDEVVADQLEQLVAEKLKGMRIVFD